MGAISDMINSLFDSNGLILAFLIVGVTMYISSFISKKLTNGRIHASAIAIVIGLVLAYVGGKVTGGENGLSDITLFAGVGVLGGSMFRDFAIVSTAYGADFKEIKKAGLAGVIALLLGVIVAFIVGGAVAYIFGYNDAASVVTIGAGACSFIVGPVTGAAIGATSEVIAISIAAGVIKSILVMIGTPAVAKLIGLNNPQSAMVYGGLMGTTSGVAAGLAATDLELVPYGAMTATFYTGLGCLLCPSILFMLIKVIL